MEKLLVINPGSTSTKIAYFEGNERIWQEDISHSRAELERFDDVLDQLEMRCALVKDAMAAHGVRAEELTALAARGGTIAPLRSGAYEVNDAMVDVILHRPQDRHASLLHRQAAGVVDVSRPPRLRRRQHAPQREMRRDRRDLLKQLSHDAYLHSPAGYSPARVSSASRSRTIWRSAE